MALGVAGRIDTVHCMLPGLAAAMLLSMNACLAWETGYFQHRVNDATADIVGERYGPPHQLDRRQDGGMVWTYYDRGSGTSGYTGMARSSYCRKYVLTFDEEKILREWHQQDCHG